MLVADLAGGWAFLSYKASAEDWLLRAASLEAAVCGVLDMCSVPVQQETGSVQGGGIGILSSDPIFFLKYGALSSFRPLFVSFSPNLLCRFYKYLCCSGPVVFVFLLSAVQVKVGRAACTLQSISDIWAPPLCYYFSSNAVLPLTETFTLISIFLDVS